MPDFRQPIHQRLTRALPVGQMIPPADPKDTQPPVRFDLPPYPQDGACTDCVYPDQCRDDSTCWGRVGREGLKRIVTPTRQGVHEPWTHKEAIAALHRYHAKHGQSPRITDCRQAEGLPPPMALVRLFGTLADALTEAGLPKRKRRGWKSKSLN